MRRSSSTTLCADHLTFDPRLGKTMHFTAITVLEVEDGLITEELGLDDGVTVLRSSASSRTPDRG